MKIKIGIKMRMKKERKIKWLLNRIGDTVYKERHKKK